MTGTDYKIVGFYDGHRDVRDVLLSAISEKYIRILKNSVVDLQGKEYNLDKVMERASAKKMSTSNVFDAMGK